MIATILIIDDEIKIRSLLARIIELEGFIVFQAPNAKEGLKIVFLTRLCPLFPFNLLNYALGITQVSLKDYVLGSFGMIPGIFMYVYSGSLVGNIAAIGTETGYANPQASAAKWSINIISLTAAAAVTFSLSRIARKALDETV